MTPALADRADPGRSSRSASARAASTVSYLSTVVAAALEHRRHADQPGDAWSPPTRRADAASATVAATAVPATTATARSPGSFQPAAAAQLVSATAPSRRASPADRRCRVAANDLSLGEHDPRRCAPSTIDGQQYRLLTRRVVPAGHACRSPAAWRRPTMLLARLRWQLGRARRRRGGRRRALGLGGGRTRLVRPIARAAATPLTGSRTTLDLSTPIDVGGTGEVGDLAASFSTMIAEVAGSQEQQRRLVSRRQPRDAHAAHQSDAATSSCSNASSAWTPRNDARSSATCSRTSASSPTLLDELVELASDLTAAERHRARSPRRPRPHRRGTRPDGAPTATSTWSTTTRSWSTLGPGRSSEPSAT